MVREVMAEVKANHALLVNCSQHNFQPIEDGTRLLLKKHKCTRCGGVVSNSAAYWYNQGLEDAG